MTVAGQMRRSCQPLARERRHPSNGVMRRMRVEQNLEIGSHDSPGEPLTTIREPDRDPRPRTFPLTATS